MHDAARRLLLNGAVMCPAAQLAAAVELQALSTLAAALTAVPAAFRSNMALLEHFVCSRLCAQSSSAPLRLAASHCLSLLPSVTGSLQHVLWFLPCTCQPHVNP